MGAALQVVTQEPERRRYLLVEAKTFREALSEAGFDLLGSETQIVPVLVGENARTLQMAGRLKERGLMAVAFRPPTVTPGRARVRFSLSAAHSQGDLTAAREAIMDVGREMGLV
jgi:7-keto-8-aminopelargonate synthetase-like enzyme